MKKIKIKYFIEYLIVYFLSIILNLLPINYVSYLGGLLLKKIGPFLRSNITAKKNYLKIFPLANNSELKKNLYLSWENLGRTFFELLILPKMIKNSEKIIKVDGLEEIKNLQKKNKTFVFIGIHQSNWELIVPMLDKLGFNVGAIYRHINNPFINQLIFNKRSKSLTNNSFYTPKGKKSAVDIIKAIKKNYSALIIVDQKDSAGEKVPFFGYNVNTQTGFLKIAKKNNMAIVPIQNTRNKLNYFDIKFHKPLNLEKNNFNSFQEMKKIHELIEKWIIQNPSDWFFQHNRFN